MDYSWAWALGREAIALARHLYLGSRLRDQASATEAASLRSALALEALARRPDRECPDLRCPPAPDVACAVVHCAAIPGCPAPAATPDHLAAVAVAVLAAVVLGYCLGRLAVGGGARPGEANRTLFVPPASSAFAGTGNLEHLRSWQRPVAPSEAPTEAPSGSSRSSSHVVTSGPGYLRLVTPKSLKDG